MTFGEKSVGLSFNPSGDDKVNYLKSYYAAVIDHLNDARNNPEATAEQRRLYSIAITEAQGAQMWAVKAATWKD